MHHISREQAEREQQRSNTSEHGSQVYGFWDGAGRSMRKMPSFELGMSLRVGLPLCSTPALIVAAPVKDLLPGMINVPRFWSRA